MSVCVCVRITKDLEGVQKVVASSCAVEKNKLLLIMVTPLCWNHWCNLRLCPRQADEGVRSREDSMPEPLA